MKNILFFCTFLLCKGLVHAQAQQPMFQTTVYFEDAVGHKDTIIVGYDTSANFSFINPQFGEIDIQAPFDSVFEVRAAHFSAFKSEWEESDFSNLTLSKKIIGGAEEYVNSPGCYAGGRILFFIYALHQPISMRWSSSDFIQSCADNAFFTPDFHYEIVNPIAWLEEPWIRYCCATKFDSCSIVLGPDATPMHEYPYILTYPVEGSSSVTDSIYGIRLYMIAGDYDSPCRLVGSSEPQEDYEAGLTVLQNPVSYLLQVEQAADMPLGDIFIVDQAGRQMYHQPGINQPVFTLPVGNWKPGVYFFVSQPQVGRRKIVKWVKR